MSRNVIALAIIQNDRSQLKGQIDTTSDRFVAVNDVELHFNEAGSGPALLCFHGGGPGANAWDNTRFNFETLAEHFREGGDTF